MKATKSISVPFLYSTHIPTNDWNPKHRPQAVIIISSVNLNSRFSGKRDREKIFLQYNARQM